jgi:predicted nucleic acid-binding protein
MSALETEPESSFIDTNVWLCAFIEGDDPQKSARAKLLIEASNTVIVSI